MESIRLGKRCSKLTNLITLVLLAMGLPGAVIANWTPIALPDGATVGYTIDPNTPATIYATNINTTGTGGGVWKSTDSGASWGVAAVNASAEFNGVAVQPGNSNVVIAGIRGVGGIERSINGGTTWASESTGDATSFWSFAFSVSTAATVYAGGSNGLLGDSGLMLKSVDTGDNWVPLTIAGDASPNVVSIAVDHTDPNTVFAGVKPTGANNDGLYKTTDGGASWTLLPNLASVITTVDSVVVDPNDRNIIYAANAATDEIWRSTDGGSTWTELFDASNNGFINFNPRGIAIDAADSRVIYSSGGTNTKVVASTDCGATWTDVTATGFQAANRPDNIGIDTVNNIVYALEPNNDGILYSETLGQGLVAASGACPVGSGGGGPGPAPVPAAPAGGGGGGGGGGGSPGLLILLATLGIKVYQGFKREKKT